MGIVPNSQLLLCPEGSQSLLRILDFSNTRVSVFPEVEEFLVMLYGFPFSTLNLKIPRLVFDSFHELLEARLSADVFEVFAVGECFTDHFSNPTFFSNVINLGSERTLSYALTILSKGSPIERSS